MEQEGSLLIDRATVHAEIDGRSFLLRRLSAFELEVDGTTVQYDLKATGEHAFSLIIDGAQYSVDLLKRSRQTPGDVTDSETLGDNVLLIGVNGRVYEVGVQDHRSMLLSSFFNRTTKAAGLHVLCAPMPGLIGRIDVKTGDSVSTGRGVLVLEAMKMENEIRCLHDGIVRQIHVEKGKTVEKGERLITIEEVVKT